MLKARAGSKALIREINEALILDIVRSRGPVARAQIAVATGLSAATVTGITGKLLRNGFLVETDIRNGTGGRPARLLELGTDTVFAAGVRLSSTEAYAALVDLRGTVVGTHREKLKSSDPADVRSSIVRAVQKVAGPRSISSLLGLGIALSGVVDQKSGHVRHSGSLGWEDVPLQAELQGTVAIPVVVDSYANSFGMGLLLFEDKLEGRDLLVFSVGTSLGASVIVQGRIHRGFNGSAGGFAHSRTSDATDRALPCHCGATNCLETRASWWGIQQELSEGIFPDKSAALADAALHLGTAMANVAKIFGPERVVLATAPEVDGPELAQQTAEIYREQYRHEKTPAPELEATTADNNSVAKGAAYMVLAQIFTANTSEAYASADLLELAVAQQG
ncbi:putative NBD/HSP70 family sugar kinase [Arthrobacter pigmenti]|uniref:Putative NBD/HSP70 family sugar kinase n=1 Tax=Arthrobacter pigmenti TaxID=271432 RepID=A0A846RKG4_9MICC|nr:ROK family transcriptional regulator [Arthrobacter pigmenti]NJC21152.1 putative NBD/HSP70 family sugar kinase [Arthrobacter pigmenti]